MSRPTAPRSTLLARAALPVLVLLTILAAAVMTGGHWQIGESRPAPANAQVAAPAPAGPAQPDTRLAVTGADPTWIDRTARATGIPARALTAYAAAEITLRTEQPDCGIGWNTIAAIGAIESDHGRHDGATLTTDGRPAPAIRGRALDGDGVAAILDTDHGRWDGDTTWDRAVGPMQFIPDTWTRWGADGDGDGTADPNDIDDAAHTTGRYLCASGPVTTADGWRAAVFSYNHLDSYVNDIAATANRYATRAGGTS
jgi:membrane-bound lytic murein transglycosylase B